MLEVLQVQKYEIITFINEMLVIENGGKQNYEVDHRQDGVEQMYNDFVILDIIYQLDEQVENGKQYIMLDDGLLCDEPLLVTH
jgi:hypothetical protein